MSNKQDTKGMKPKVQRQLVPQLRFPEFWKAEKWEVKSLDDFATIVRGGSPRPIDEYITSDVNGLNWLKIGDINKESKFVTSTQEKVISAALTKTRVVNPGDLILSNSMSFGRPYILKIKTCIHDGWIAVSDIDSSLDRDYLYYLMMAPASQTYFLNNAAGSGVQNLNADIIKLLPVPHPNKKEQQKIAECLASIDDRITLETKKLAALRDHKKGLMQKLFPAEGQTLPQLRFPEFCNAGDWKPDTLENLCTAKISYGIVQAGPHVPNGMPYIKSTDLNSELCLASLARTSDVIAQKYRRSEVVPGDLVFSLRGNIGVAQIVPKDIPVANLTQGTARIRPQGPPEFYLQALRSQPVYSRILSVSKGSTFQEISLEALRKIRLFHPEIDEQQRIADCLSSLDELIALQAQKTDVLKLHKQGLMQQLFPSIDEVSR